MITHDIPPKIEPLDRIRELIRTGEIANLDHWGDGKFIIGENGQWHYEGFVMRSIPPKQYQSDRRRMKAYIASRIPEEGIEVVLAEGHGGDVCVQLDPVRYDDGEWDLHWETNCKELVGLSDIYHYFRRQEMTMEEWRREFSGEVARLQVKSLGKMVTSLRNEMNHPGKPAINCTLSENERALPREVSTAEAASILGVSKDTVLKLKATGLLEYRIASPPGSFRPVFRFLLDSVLQLRTRYDTDEPTPSSPRELHRRRAARRIKKYRHVKLDVSQ